MSKKTNQEDMECILREMRELIWIAETTRDSNVKRQVVERLRKLSGIPKDNPYADRTVYEYIQVTK